MTTSKKKAIPKTAEKSLKSRVFQMPSVQTMVSRKSSVTNAFVNSVIPCIEPSDDEVEQALRTLGMTAETIACAYCGDKQTEWDHLRPLVSKMRPTGYISEIANLVPACGKCNQSKGNKPWREWMLSPARLSPAGRGIADVSKRFKRLEAYEAWREATKINFEKILGTEHWSKYWSLWEALNNEMRRCQEVADELRDRIKKALHSG